MKIVLENCDDINFVKYLIKFLRKYLINSINVRKLVKWDDYLNSLPIFQTKYKRYISTKEILYAAAYNIKFMKHYDTYIIYIDQNQKIFGTDAKLYSICKLITYGNLQMQGYPVILDAFNYTAENIQFLYFKYRRGF